MAEFPEGSDRISVSVGLEHWREGETTISVDSQGKVDVNNQRAGKATHFTGTLTTQQVDELAAAVSAIAFATPHTQPRQPGDVPVKIAWFSGETALGRNDAFWYGDRYTMPDINQVLRLFNQLVKQVSNGKITT